MTKKTFDEFLAPEIMNLLVARYAERLPEAGTLRWEYGRLGRRTWGVYYSTERKLVVNDSKTRGKFRQQVETVLHEIEHWNQDVRAALEAGDVREGFSRQQRAYRYENRAVGYRANRYEVGAREFAAANLDEAIRLASDALSGKIDGDLEDALEELVDELDGAERTTRGVVGRTLAEYRLNSRENLTAAIEFLRELGVAVR